MWIARDKDGLVFIYLTKPLKLENRGYWDGSAFYTNIPDECYPEVKWEDEEPRELILK